MAISITREPIQAEKFVISPLPNRNYDSCLVRQKITTVYAGENTMREALFENVGRSFESSRTYIIPVPKGATLQQVQAELNKHPDATIWKILSHSPIMTPELENAKALGYTDDSKIEARQRVKNPNAVTEDLLDRINGKVQYHLLGFSLTEHADEDRRVHTDSEMKLYRERQAAMRQPVDDDQVV